MTHLAWILLVAALAAACDRPTNSSALKQGAQASKPEAAAPTPNNPPTASAMAVVPSPSANSASMGARLITFDGAQVGSPAPDFEAVVGDWYVAREFGAQGLKVDGSKWRNGTPSANIADQAKRLYGERYAEFLDGVKAFAFFPFAVWQGDVPSGDLRISVRFYPNAGRVDQAAGIAFAILPDGTYRGVRANALEDNVLYFKVVKGKRTIIDTVRNVPTPTHSWHDLVVELRGKHVSALLDGQKRFEKALETEPVGRIGLWSKADSEVLFDDFKVEPIQSEARPALP
ncbi:MAG: hypothetical protein ACOY0T_21495 [Myxococcota bacterium]